MAKSHKRPRQEGGRLIIGLGWYSPLQWKRLKEIVADPCQIEDTYQEWLAKYEQTLRELIAKGLDVRKVSIDVGELEKWCITKNRPIDGSARAAYVLERVRQTEAVKAFSDEDPL